MRNEAVVADSHELTDEGVGLNPAALADRCSFLDLNERSDESIVADIAAVEICRLYNGHICAELNVNEPNCTAPDWCSYGRILIGLTWPFSGRARSRIETTVRACSKPVRGLHELRMQSAKCSASTRSGSANLTCGYQNITTPMVKVKGARVIEVHVLAQDGAAINAFVVDSDLVSLRCHRKPPSCASRQ